MKKILNCFILFVMALVLCSFKTPTNTISVLENNNERTIKVLTNIEIDFNNIETVMDSVGVGKTMLSSFTEHHIHEFSIAKRIIVMKSNFYINNRYTIVKSDVNGGGVPDEVIHKANGPDNDSYINMTYIFTELPNRKLKFMVEAQWFKMPFFRKTDSLGCISMFTAIDYNSMFGYMSYDYSLATPSVKANSSCKEVFTKENFSDAINGNWHGGICIFKLPVDIMARTHSKIHSNVKIYFEYYGYFNGNIENAIINTSATYSHQKSSFNIEPSISISIGTKPEIGLGLSFFNAYDHRTIRIPYAIKLTNI